MGYTLVILFSVWGLFTPSPALAQYGAWRPAGYYQPPTLSPYLNLVRQGADPGFNYASLVRPQINFTGSLQQLQQEFAVGQQAVTNLETAATLPTTGHAAGYFTHTSYFFTLGRGMAPSVLNRTLPVNTVVAPTSRPGLPGIR
jgi:hypothetical protein